MSMLNQLLEKEIKRMGERAKMGLPVDRSPGTAAIGEYRRTMGARNAYQRGDIDATAYEGDWNFKQAALKEMQMERGPQWGDIPGNAYRDLSEMVKGMGQLIGGAVKSTVTEPGKALKFATSGYGDLFNKQKWKDAYAESAPYRSIEPEKVPEIPENMGQTLQKILAETGRGYASLVQDPKRRAIEHPLFTALDILPVATAGVKAASAGAQAAKLPKLAETLAGLSPEKLPGTALKAAGKRVKPLGDFLETQAAKKDVLGRIKRVDREHYNTRGELEQMSRDVIDPLREVGRSRIDPKLVGGNLAQQLKRNRGIIDSTDQVLSGTAEFTRRAQYEPIKLPADNPIKRALGISKTIEMSPEKITDLNKQLRQIIGERSTKPAAQQVTPGTDFARLHRDRELLPLRRALTGRATKNALDRMDDTQIQGYNAAQSRNPYAAITDKDVLNRKAESILPAQYLDQAEVDRLVKRIEARGGTAKLVADKNMNGSLPVIRGDEVHYAPRTPMYVPMHPEAQAPRGFDWLLGNPRGAKVGKPYLKGTAEDAPGIPMQTDIGDVYRRHFAQVRRSQFNMQLMADIEAKYPTKTLTSDPDSIAGLAEGGYKIDRRNLLDPYELEEWTKKGYVPFDRDGYMRFYKMQVGIEDQLLKELDRIGVSQPNVQQVEQILANLINQHGPIKDITALAAAKNRKITMLPKGAADELSRRISQPGELTRFLVYKPTDIWRQIVLGNPRWVVNNLVGNVILNTVRGVTPDKYIDALKSFWEKYDNIIPADVKRTFTDTEGTVRHSGEFNSGTLSGKIAAFYDKPMSERSFPVRLAGSYLKGIQTVNNYVEEFFRRANYLQGAMPLARKNVKARMQKTGIRFFETNEVLKELENFTKEIADYDPVISGIKGREELWNTAPATEALRATNEFLFDYSDLTTQERRVFRTIFPFYSWYKNILRLTMTLPVKHPMRARTMKAVTDVGNELAAENPEVPEYMASSVPMGEVEQKDPLTGETKKMTRFLNTRGANPFNTVLEAQSWPNSVNPGIKALMEWASGRDLLTGRDFEREGIERDYTTGRYKRLTPTGEWEEVSRIGGLKTPLVRIANQMPPVKMLLDSIAGGRRYDDSFTSPQIHHKTGEVAAPFDAKKEFLKLSGVSLTDMDMERMQEARESENKRVTTRKFRGTAATNKDALLRAMKKIQERERRGVLVQ